MQVPFQAANHGHFRGCRVIATAGEGCRTCQRKAYALAGTLALGAALFEWWGSMLTGSLALFGDAVHVGADSLGYWLGLLMLLVTRTRRHQRWFLAVLTALLCWSAYTILGHAYQRFTGGAVTLRGDWQLLLPAALGFLVNLWVLGLLRRVQVPHHHFGHGMDPDHEVEHLMLRGNLGHTVSDLGCSALVMLVGALWWLSPGAQWVVRLELGVATLIAGFLVLLAFKLGRVVLTPSDPALL